MMGMKVRSLGVLKIPWTKAIVLLFRVPMQVGSSFPHCVTSDVYNVSTFTTRARTIEASLNIDGPDIGGINRDKVDA